MTLTANSQALEKVPPRVRGWPILGNTLQLMREPVQFFVDATAALGPVFSFNVLGVDYTVVSGQAGLDLVKAHGSGIIDRRGLFDAFASDFSFEIFEAMGAQHEKLKSLVRLGYSRQLLSQYTAEIVEETSKIVDGWPDGGHVQLFADLRLITLRCAMRALTPIDLSGCERDVARFSHSVMNATLGLRPSATLYNPAHLLRLARLRRLVDGAIERHARGELKHEPRLSMIDAFLGARTASGEALTKLEVRGASLYALGGTYIYLGRVVAFMLMEILKNPALYERVKAEADALFSEVGSHGVPDPANFGRMQHLRAAYREAMRVYPLLPGLPFRAATDFQLGGYAVREGQRIIVSPVPGHFLNAGYENPQAFDALRAAPPRNEHRCPFGWAPYGIAPRMCVAAGMVELVSIGVIATILHRRKLALQKPSYRPSLRMYPLIGPSDDLPARIGAVRTAADRTATMSVLADDADADAIADSWQSLSLPPLVPRRFDAGHDVVREGEDADAFYIILTGTAAVLQRTADGRDEEVLRLGDGDSFGERGLLKGVPRAATVRAVTELRVLQLAREEFLALATDADLLGAQLGRVILQRYVRAALKDAIPGAAAAMTKVDAIGVVHKLPGEYVFRQGEVADRVYVVSAGQVEVFHERDGGALTVLATLRSGDVFGEIGVLQSRPRTATVRATTDVVLLAIERDALEALIKDAPTGREQLATLIGQRLMRIIEAMT